MNYPLLHQGDRLPVVGVLQKLLSRTGIATAADGDFGPRTGAAVRRFQSERRIGGNGTVEAVTWERLCAGERSLRIVDCVDVFDPSLYRLERADIQRAGGNPLLIGGMSNGVEQAISLIVGSAAPGSVMLLRFHGHGGPGTAGVGVGDGSAGWGGNRSTVDGRAPAAMTRMFARLRPIFGPYGCIQFMHCSTGQGATGRALLESIARGTGVPVTAAIRDQLGGGLTTFRYEGPTHTSLPHGGSLSAWCRALPDFVGASVR